MNEYCRLNIEYLRSASLRVGSRRINYKKTGLVLSSATLHFVGWVEPISGYVGFRFTQPNLHFVNSIVLCETQQWPILEPRSKNV